jgi:DNA-binding response OmpR family regulator
MTDLRLLVVDDEPEFGEFVRAVAEDLGYEVEVTTRGDDFKLLYDVFNPTVVLLDIIMPEIDGTELVSWLAGRHCTAEIIVATGYSPRYAAAAGSLGRARGLRSVTTLTKPIPIAELRAALPH